MTQRVALTTIVRGAPPARPSGWLRIVGRDAGLELARAPLPEARWRWAERSTFGGARGGRGLAAHGDRLVACVNDRVLILDREWRVERTIEHPLLGWIHDVIADPGGLWVTCSANDLLIRLSWDGRIVDRWSWRSHMRLRRRLGHLAVPPLERGRDYGRPDDLRPWHDLGHVNAVLADGDDLLVGLGKVRERAVWLWPAAVERAVEKGGAPARTVVGAWRASPLARLGRNWGAGRSRRPRGGGDAGDGRGTAAISAIVRVSPNGGRTRARLVLTRPRATVPTHNLARLGDLLVVNDSSAGSLIAVDPATGAVRYEVALPGQRPFPRGLLDLSGGRYLVGAQKPLALHEVDLFAGTITRTIALDGDPDESVYAIAELPDSFADPRGRLPATREGWGSS